ncbi:unnamed protein product [Peniophora sp. CBMAI 1063]|nr:unnamed protein product [Peniophora sp. CBMAI 1063]
MDVPPPVLRSALMLIAERTRKVERLGWITASHVCQRWRVLMLRMPLLWAGVSGGIFPSRDICEVMIKRAGDRPLSFFGDWPSHANYVRGSLVSTTDTVTELIPSYRSRVEELALRIDGRAEAKTICGHHLPQLKRLYLEAYDILPYDDADAIDAPQLRSLRMDYIVVPFQAQNLRFLSIDIVNAVNELSRAAFHVIELAPMLEELELSHFAFRVEDDEDEPEDDEGPIPLSTPIDLHALTSLTYDGLSKYLHVLLQSFLINEGARISVEIPGRDSQLNLFIILQDMLQRVENDHLCLSFSRENSTWSLFAHVYPSADGPCHEIDVVDRRGRNGVHISAISDCIANAAEIDIAFTTPDTFISALVARLNTHNIRSLDLDLVLNLRTNEHGGPNDIGEALQPLKNVSTIAVGRGCDMNALKALFLPEDAAIPLPFPDLKTLVLKHPRECASEGLGGIDQMLRTWATLGHLCGALMVRHHPLSCIRVAAFNLEELGGNEDAWRAQERLIKGARAWVDEVELTV